MDTQFAAETAKKYHAKFMRLMDEHLPHGNAAYQDLWSQMDGELQEVYGEDSGKALSEAGTETIALTVEMTTLAHPRLVEPK